MKRVFLFASVLLFLAGCTAKPIYNVDNVAVVTGSGSAPSLADVRGAIIKAVTSKGWTVKDIDSMHLLATLSARKHMAQVVIAYSTSSFSIAYKDSHMLDYKGTTIHRNYNRWIHNIEQRIKEQLVAI
jgi:hypothetical protein